MKIIFDARYTLIGRQDGISRYGINLLKALAQEHDDIIMLIYDKRQLEALPNLPYIMSVNPYGVGEILLPHYLNKLRADIVYSPFLTMGLGNFGRRYKVIVTTHDLIYYHDPTPSTYLPKIYRPLTKLFASSYGPQRFLLNQADHVVTVSQTVKQQLEEKQLTQRPISVVYNAPVQLPTVELKPTTKDLIYMGVLKPYKNVELLIKAMALLPEYTLHLLSVVAPERQAELEAQIKDKTQVKFWNGVSDVQYASLLSSATALVTASKEEGFGLPLLEAMSEGVPVICSDIPIFHEVARNAALFFDYNDPAQFAQTVHRLENSAERARLIKAGREQAACFSWATSARTLYDLIQHVANNASRSV